MKTSGGVPQGSTLMPFLFIYQRSSNIPWIRVMVSQTRTYFSPTRVITTVQSNLVDNKMMLNLKTTRSTWKRIFDYALNDVILERTHLTLMETSKSNEFPGHGDLILFFYLVNNQLQSFHFITLLYWLTTTATTTKNSEKKQNKKSKVNRHAVCSMNLFYTFIYLGQNTQKYSCFKGHLNWPYDMGSPDKTQTHMIVVH